MEQTVISMSRRARRKKIGGKVMTYIGLSVVAIFLLFPYMFMLNRSFMTYDDASSIRPVYFFPHSGITFTNFIRIFSENNYLKYTLNTLKIAAFNIVAVTLSSSICAYSFSRIDWKCKGFVFAAMMATVMIPGSILTIPQYVLFANLGWTESAKPLMIPTLFGGGALNIFLLTQFMKGVSREMENAAAEHRFYTLDVESMRRHYNRTLLCWNANFQAHKDEVRKMFDEQFVRMWELYLCACAATFYNGIIDLHQILWSKGVNNELPMTRWY